MPTLQAGISGVVVKINVSSGEVIWLLRAKEGFPGSDTGLEPFQVKYKFKNPKEVWGKGHDWQRGRAGAKAQRPARSQQL